MHRFVIVVALAVVGAACARDPGARGGKLGTERADCRAGSDACDLGLMCLSNLCVRPPPADCAAVAATLTSMDLGNYAAVEERAPVIEKYQAGCEAAYLTKEEGACIDKAPDRWTASQCAPRMFPELKSTGTGDCAKVADKIRGSYGAQGEAFRRDPKMSKWFDATIRIVQESCEQDAWPDAVKQCALASSPNDPNAMNRCNQTMPAALQKKLQDRMVAAMKLLQ